MLLRCESGELDAELGTWWSDFIEGDRDEREALMDAANPRGKPRSGDAPKKRRRRKSSGGSGSDGGSDGGSEGGSDAGGSDAGNSGGSASGAPDRPPST